MQTQISESKMKKLTTAMLVMTLINILIAILSLSSCKKVVTEPKYIETNTNYFYRLAAYNPDSSVDHSIVARIGVRDILETLSDGDDDPEEKEEPELLPLKLVYFKVGVQNGKIMVAWQHTDEADVVKYVIEKSIDTANGWTPVYTQLPTHRLPYEYLVEDKFPIKSK